MVRYLVSNGEVRKGGLWNTETYLGEPVLVQNTLLELVNFQTRYVASVVSTGRAGEWRRRRSQAELHRETAFRPSWGAKHLSYAKHWRLT